MSKPNGRTIQPALFEPDPLRVPALRMRQGRDRVLYAFAVDGKRVEEFAAVSRVGRDENRRIVGYQRPEVISHIAEIREATRREEAALAALPYPRATLEAALLDLQRRTEEKKKRDALPASGSRR